jgi:hypothetical protein
LKELGFAAQDKTDTARMAFAHLALSKMNSWQITPIPKNGLFVDYAEDFSKTIREEGLLPTQERNDGLILAEASLHGMSILITSDSHFFKIPPNDLALIFTDCHLPRPVVPVRPVTATNLLLRSAG